jgi:NTE family protein
VTRRITVALSGGGIKTAAHLTAVKVLREAAFVPSRYVATSMGAIMAVGLSLGLPHDELVGRFLTLTRRDVAAIDRTSLLRGIFARALFREAPLRKALERGIPVRRFDELPVPLTITTTDLDTGELILFGDGGLDAPLLDVLYATCALPLLYPVGLIGGRRLADGGIRGVVPLEAASYFPADLVVAVDAGAGFDQEQVPVTPMPALLQAHNDAQGILMADNTRLARMVWERTPARPPLLYIRPKVRRAETFAIDQVPYYLAEGERAAREALRLHAGT